MLLLPAFGGGWTECEVAELRNGSVLMTSRNFYGASSGQGARLMARSDDGGSTWAANWTARDLPDPYCEGSILSNAAAGSLLFANPSSHVRANFSLHQSFDDGSTWPVHHVVYGGGSAYSLDLVENPSNAELDVRVYVGTNDSSDCLFAMNVYSAVGLTVTKR